MVLSLIEAQYMALTLTKKDVNWLRLLLIGLSLFKTQDRYTKIYFNKKNSSIQAPKDYIKT